MAARDAIVSSLLLLTGMVLFGSATPLSKLVAAEFPVFTASLVRVVVGALVVVPVMGDRWSRLADLSGRDWLVISAIAAFGMFGFTSLLLYGMRLIPGTVGAIVMSTTPALTAAASVLFLGDTWTRRKVAAIGLAVVGIVVVHGGGISSLGPGQDLLLGSALVLGAVACEAAYTLLGKVATDRVDPILTVFLACALSAPLFLAASLGLERGAVDLAGVSPDDWLTILAWGGGTLGLGSVLWYQGVQRTSGSVAAGYMGVMPVSALLLSYVLLGEPVRWQHLLGFGIVFAGVVLISREHAEAGHDD